MNKPKTTIHWNAHLLNYTYQWEVKVNGCIFGRLWGKEVPLLFLWCRLLEVGKEYVLHVVNEPRNRSMRKGWLTLKHRTTRNDSFSKPIIKRWSICSQQKAMWTCVIYNFHWFLTFHFHHFVYFTVFTTGLSRKMDNQTSTVHDFLICFRIQ